MATTTATRPARTWAALAHASALIGLLGNGIGFLLGPLVVWFVKREESAFVNEQGKEALNFQMTMLIAMILAGILSFALIGIPTLIGLVIVDVVFSVVAAVKANEGVAYRYPFSVRFIQ